MLARTEIQRCRNTSMTPFRSLAAAARPAGSWSRSNSAGLARCSNSGDLGNQVNSGSWKVRVTGTDTTQEFDNSNQISRLPVGSNCKTLMASWFALCPTQSPFAGQLIDGSSHNRANNKAVLEPKLPFATLVKVGLDLKVSVAS